MAQKQAHPFPKGQRVRLKLDGTDQLYAKARAGAQGWVHAVDHDEYGYPMIMIRWDQEHWTYSGEADKWTMAAHFEAVEETKMAASGEPPFDNADEFADFMAAWQAFQASKKDQDESQGEQPEHEYTDAPQPVEGPNETFISKDSDAPLWPDTQDEDLYLRRLEQAAQIAKAGKAFVLMVVREVEVEDSSLPVMTPVIGISFQTKEAGVYLESQLARLMASAHEELMVSYLQLLAQREDAQEDEDES